MVVHRFLYLDPILPYLTILHCMDTNTRHPDLWSKNSAPSTFHHNRLDHIPFLHASVLSGEHRLGV